MTDLHTTRVLRRFPSETTVASSQSYSKSAFKSVWSQLEDTMDRNILLPYMKATVFNSVKDFVKQAHDTPQKQIPVGCLFNGSPVQILDISPMKFLAAILRDAGCIVIELDSRQMDSIDKIWDEGLRQVSDHKEGHIEMLTRWYSQQDNQPFVIMMDYLDKVDRDVLVDLMNELGCQRRGNTLPATLLAGLYTETIIDPLLPSYLCETIKSSRFSLMTPSQCFEKAIESALLSPACPTIVVGQEVMELLNDCCIQNYFTISTFRDYIKVSLKGHMDNPVGCLLQYMTPATLPHENNLKDVPGTVVDAVKPIRRKELPGLLKSVLEEVSGWKVALLWTHYLADITGSSVAGGRGYSLRELYTDALKPRFLASRQFPKVAIWLSCLESLEPDALKRLTDGLEKMLEVAKQFSECCPPLNEEINELFNYKSNLERLTETKRIEISNNKTKRTRLYINIENVCKKVDKVVCDVMDRYLAHPPERKRGKHIFCLASSEHILRHLAAAPRLEVTNTILEERYHSRFPDDSFLLQDSVIVYKTLAESEGRLVTPVDSFIAFASHFGVPVDKRRYDPARGDSEDSQDSSDSRDDENHGPEVTEFRARYELAIRALEQLGIVRRVTRGGVQYITLGSFND